MQALQISIPKPCHEDWQKMTAAEQGKFCGACQKTVVDFSNMSDGEIVRLFEQKKGKLCGRFASTQLERPIEPTKIYKTNWFKWVMQLIVPMALFTKSSFGQKKVPKQPTTTTDPNKHVIVGKYISRVEPKKDTTPNKIDSMLKHQMPSCFMIGRVKPTTKKIDSSLLKPIAKKIEGIVVDEKGNPFSYVSIQIKGTHIGIASGADGKFSLLIPFANFNDTLVFSYVGFENKEIPIQQFAKNLADNKTILKIKNLPELAVVELGPVRNSRLMGDVVIVRSTKTKKQIRKINKPFVIEPVNSFTLFPNPIPSGQILNISATVKKAGVYYLELISTDGELMMAKEVRLATTNEKVELQTSDDWAAGTYFLRILDADKKFVFNSKVVIL